MKINIEVKPLLNIGSVMSYYVTEPSGTQGKLAFDWFLAMLLNLIRMGNITFTLKIFLDMT